MLYERDATVIEAKSSNKNIFFIFVKIVYLTIHKTRLYTQERFYGVAGFGPTVNVVIVSTPVKSAINLRIRKAIATTIIPIIA